MSKLRLDYFLSLGLKPSERDSFYDEKDKLGLVFDGVIPKGELFAGQYNFIDASDGEDGVYAENELSIITITSLAERKNTGEQPCGDDVPVRVSLGGDDIDKGYGNPASIWRWTGCSITEWKPDIEALIKMQDEHDKQITLADLKPKRTKTEYVKVESFKDAITLMINSETLHSKSGDGHLLFNGSHFINHYGIAIDINCLSEKEFYRKVEREVSWHDELDNFLCESDVTAYSINDGRGVKLSGWLRYSDFIDMCHLVASMTDKPE